MHKVYVNKTISCGAIIIKDKKFLIARPSWKNPYWNIPKGTMDNNETEYQTAIREIKEECNIDITPLLAINLGKFNYLKNKDLILFSVYLDNNVEYKIKCNCTYIASDGKVRPEMVDFKWIELDEYKKYLSKGLENLFSLNYSLLNNIINK